MKIDKLNDFTHKNPNGWVNVKIDDQLFMRMGKYVSALDTIMKNSNERYNLYEKVKTISKIDTLIQNKSASIQTIISIITLLQYLKEIRHQFNPSSSGFLFEGFLATLIHGKIIPGNKEADIESSYDKIEPVGFITPGRRKLNYQIKLYKKGGNIKINMKENCDYYVICLKDGESKDSKIDIHILNGRDADDKYYIGGTYSVNKRGTKDITDLTIKNFTTIRNDKDIVTKKFLSISTKKLEDDKDKRDFPAITLDIGDLDSKIKACGEEIQNSLVKVYNELSELHYDIDSLVSGFSDNKKISIKNSEKKAILTIGRINKEIEKLALEISTPISQQP